MFRVALPSINPINYNDPTGHWAETGLDLISLGMTIQDINDNGLGWQNGIGLAADVVSLAAPGVAGGGAAVRYADEAYAAGKAGVNAAWDWGKGLLGYGDEAADAGSDAARQADNLPGNPCAINSFSADTPVMTATGLKPINELVEGDLVLAYNEATGEIGVYPITDTISHVDPEIVLLTIDGDPSTGSGIETLETTAEHPFYELESAPWLVAGEQQGRWTDALDLQVGDQIWQADGTTGTVQVVTVVPGQQRMYNLSVATAHTFFVGQQQWLVHNADCIPNISQVSIPGPTNSPYGKVDYLLGKVPGNQESIGKGGFFGGVLGFTDDTLAPALQQHLLDNFGTAQFYTRNTPRASVTGIIKGANGREATITTVWELLEDGTYRFITATPAK